MVTSDDDSLLINNYYNYICRLDSGVETIPEIEKIMNTNGKELVGNALLKDLRQQFVNTTSAASKFRVGFDDDGNQVFFNEKYEKDPFVWPRSKVDKSYYLYNFALYNPVKLTSNPSLERLREMKSQAKARKINTKEAVEVVVSYLQKEFRNVIPITTVNDD